MWRWLHRHHVTIHSYDDDTQLYSNCTETVGSPSAAQLLRCVTDIADWMTSRRLKVNAEKTQFIVLHNVNQPSATVCWRLHCVCVEPRRDVWHTAHHETPHWQCGTQLLLSASSVTFCSKITDWWSTAHPRPRVHHKPHWLLKRCRLRCRWQRHPTYCSQSCTLPRDWSPASDATSTSHRHCVTLFTGCRYYSASPSKLRWWCLTVLAADVLWWCVHTCPHHCCLFVIMTTTMMMMMMCNDLMCT